jgi:hypothetical protein
LLIVRFDDLQNGNFFGSRVYISASKLKFIKPSSLLAAARVSPVFSFDRKLKFRELPHQPVEYSTESVAVALSI